MSESLTLSVRLHSRCRIDLVTRQESPNTWASRAAGPTSAGSSRWAARTRCTLEWRRFSTSKWSTRSPCRTRSCSGSGRAWRTRPFVCRTSRSRPNIELKRLCTSCKSYQDRPKWPRFGEISMNPRRISEEQEKNKECLDLLQILLFIY